MFVLPIITVIAITSNHQNLKIMLVTSHLNCLSGSWRCGCVRLTIIYCKEFESLCNSYVTRSGKTVVGWTLCFLSAAG